MLGPLLVRPGAAAALAPEVCTVLLSAAGLRVVIAGKLSLGRSFGLMPANRGVVSTGLYRIVRHPIYMGYLITHVGFLAANPSLWNIVVLVGGRRRAAGARGLRRADAAAGRRLPRLPADGAVAGGAGSVLSRYVLVPRATCYVRSRATVAPRWDSAASQNSSTSACFSSAACTMPRCTPLPRP